VKRWAFLAFLSMGAVSGAVLLAFGSGFARTMIRVAPPGSWQQAAWAGGLLLLGLTGFTLSLVHLVRSVAKAVAPRVAEKPSSLIYQGRILRRGPRIVALGGGSGLSTVLRGLKRTTSNLTAVVTVTDDGGSSGRLREAIDVLPPGDVRNCLIALADDEERFAAYFQHRMTGPGEMTGHALGNLLLVGLEQATGGFDRAVEAMSHFLNIRGQVLPATLDRAQLVATMEDGERVVGESRLAADPRRIQAVSLLPESVQPYERVLREIKRADLIVLGPGSLFTSVIPNLLIQGVAEAVEASRAEKLLVANLMTQHGETDEMTLRDHLAVLNQYVRLHRFDWLLVNASRPDEAYLAQYLGESAEPVVDDLPQPDSYGLTVIREDLLGTARWAGKQTVKHDPRKLARAIARHTQAFAPYRRRAAGAAEISP